MDSELHYPVDLVLKKKRKKNTIVVDPEYMVIMFGEAVLDLTRKTTSPRHSFDCTSVGLIRDRVF